MNLSILTILAGFWFIFNVVSLPISVYSTKDDIKRIETIQLTLDQQRKNYNVTEYERATITKEIINWNSTIAARNNKNILWRSKLWIHKDWINVKYLK